MGDKAASQKEGQSLIEGEHHRWWEIGLKKAVAALWSQLHRNGHVGLAQRIDVPVNDANGDLEGLGQLPGGKLLAGTQK